MVQLRGKAAASFVLLSILATSAISTVTTTSSVACPTRPVYQNPRLPHYHCGTRGTVTDSGWLLSFQYSPYGNLNACYDACLADKRCVSYAEDDNSDPMVCMTYNKTVNELNFTKHGYGMLFTNLRGCFAIPSGCSTNGVVRTPCFGHE